MKNIMNNVSNWWSNLSNATKIRTSISVRKRLEIINFLMILFVVEVVALAVVSMVIKEMYSFCMVVAAIFILITFWLYGLRRAVAESQEARQNYLRESGVRFRRACSRLANLFLVLVLVGAGIAAAVIALALCIKIGAVPTELLTLLPALEELANSIVARLNTMLENLLVYIN